MAWRRARRLAGAAVLGALMSAARAEPGPAPVPVPAQASAASSASSASAAPTAPCPAGLPAGTRCLSGRDELGAGYWMAVPEPWNGTLVLHAHGGPELGPPRLERSAQDLLRWAVFVRSGAAWAGSTYRQGGVAVRAAAEDTERLRQRFINEIGMPRFTLLHGQSWGASVAARAAEIFTAAPGAKPPFDAVLLTSGVLAGGTLTYDFRLDLRVVYQAVCANHPAPGEASYPLWQGLPAGATLTHQQLARRVDACTGIRRASAERTPAQQRHLKTLLAVLRIPERSLIGHLSWATWHFQDIALNRTGGRNVFGNIGVRYVGSDDDDALNAAVARYAVDPAAVSAFGADADPQGRIPVPVLTLHGVDDPVAFVELESAFRSTMERAGTANHLVQVFTADTEHSYFSDVQYLAAADALRAWAQGGERPTGESVARRFAALEAGRPATNSAPVGEPAVPHQGCRILPDYRSAPLASRVPAR